MRSGARGQLRDSWTGVSKGRSSSAERTRGGLLTSLRGTRRQLLRLSMSRSDGVFEQYMIVGIRYVSVMTLRPMSLGTLQLKRREIIPLKNHLCWCLVSGREVLPSPG